MGLDLAADRYADLDELDPVLAAALRKDDEDEQFGRIEADDRGTCYACRTRIDPDTHRHDPLSGRLVSA